MRGLYRGKYIVAIYDKDDCLVDVGCVPKELKRNFKDYETAHQVLSKTFKRDNLRKRKRIYFIDVTEKHDDIFAEEDELFLKYIEQENNKKGTYEEAKETAKRMGISVRTLYRRNKLNMSKKEDINTL